MTPEAGHELALDVLRESSKHIQVHVRGELRNEEGSNGIWCGHVAGIRTF